jgi:nucleotide-binding universal stress UspA family protein
VLAGVDDVLNDAAALNFAFADARRHAGPVVVLHARHGVGQIEEHLSGTERAGKIVDLTHLSHALSPWAHAYPDVPVKIDIVPGHPSSALVGAAAHARLLVVGSRGRSAPARALFGSTSRELLRRSPTPVAVLPAGVTSDRIPDVTEPEHAVVTGTGIEHPHDHSQLW